MTALKPSESWLVRGVASERYPLNKVCAHPECREDAVDPHHIWPRSFIGNDSWFVGIHEPAPAPVDEVVTVLPHVSGLCRAHHDDIEEHRAWIKFEEGDFRWYDRDAHDDGTSDWTLLGPLNPQPGSREGRPKRKKHRGEARRNRITLSIKVPQDAQEDGAGVFDEAVEMLEQRISGDDHRPIYYTLMDALNFTILNAGDDDL